MAKYTEYDDLKIGVLSTTQTEVANLTGGYPPHVSFQEAVTFPEDAGGDLRLLGKPVIVWAWPVGLPTEFKQSLRTYISSGMSDTVFIDSPDEIDDIQTWQAKMQWQTDPVPYRSFDHTGGFVLRFTRCEQQ